MIKKMTAGTFGLTESVIKNDSSERLVLEAGEAIEFTGSTCVAIENASLATQVDPEILIVDEILSVGDLNFQQKSEAKMRSMITGGTTVLYVSHSIDSIRSLCDKVVWLDHGKVVMSGNTEKVCQAYYDSQVSK